LARLCHVIPASKALRWLTVPPVGAGPNPHHMGVDGTRHTVLHLSIQLGKSVPLIDTGLLHIPHSSLLNNVPHEEPLDGLVLRAAFAAVGAADEFDVSTSVLVPTAIPTLESHGRGTISFFVLASDL